MKKRREIDERDVDRLLAALTDRQIAELFGMSEKEVSELRKKRSQHNTARNSDPTED